jgi:predicted RNase H-like nuclease (RuvC/YqgF family)
MPCDVDDWPPSPNTLSKQVEELERKLKKTRETNERLMNENKKLKYQIEALKATIEIVSDKL